MYPALHSLPDLLAMDGWDPKLSRPEEEEDDEDLSPRTVHLPNAAICLRLPSAAVFHTIVDYVRHHSLPTDALLS